MVHSKKILARPYFSNGDIFFLCRAETLFLNRTPLLPYLQLLYQGFGGLKCPDLTIIALHTHWTKFKLHEAIMPVHGFVKA